MRMNWTVMSNTSAQACLPLEDTTNAKALKTMAYAVIMLASLVGNSAIILVIFKAPRMRTTTNYLIANMAVSDLLLPIFAMPRMLVAVHFDSNRWLIGGTLGLALCKLTPLFQDVSTAVSTQSLVLIAADRFYNVFYPVKAAVMSTSVPKLIIPVTWVTAFVIHSPYFYIYRTSTHENQEYCLLSWSPLFDNIKAQKAYFVLLFTLLFGIPLCVIAALYTAIIMRLKRQAFPGQHQSENSRRLREKRNRVILQLSVVIVVVFILCWTPFVTYVFLKFFQWATPLCGHENAFFSVNFVAHSISAINPCIYFLFSSSYRQGLKAVFSRASRGCISSRVLPTTGIEQIGMRLRIRSCPDIRILN